MMVPWRVDSLPNIHTWVFGAALTLTPGVCLSVSATGSALAGPGAEEAAEVPDHPAGMVERGVLEREEGRCVHCREKRPA